MFKVNAMKYCELKLEKSFNWYEALTQPEESIVWTELEDLSGHWVTCACGNQCEVIPRDKQGRPFDKALRYLGFAFCGSIMQQNKKSALKYLDEIEKRAAELIKEMA